MARCRPFRGGERVQFQAFVEAVLMCEKPSDATELRTTMPPNYWGISNSHSWEIERRRGELLVSEPERKDLCAWADQAEMLDACLECRRFQAKASGSAMWSPDSPTRLVQHRLYPLSFHRSKVGPGSGIGIYVR